MLTGLIQNWWQILFKGQNENRIVESLNGLAIVLHVGKFHVNIWIAIPKIHILGDVYEYFMLELFFNSCCYLRKTYKTLMLGILR